ncbi:MAG: hypothetical protein M1817_006350 [Caeruleum heppii]|nr:MAG: hypothetical protein M1817_006350 [Caeruleum heppii]
MVRLRRDQGQRAVGLPQSAGQQDHNRRSHLINYQTLPPHHETLVPPKRPQLPRDFSSHTQSLLSLIPNYLSPQTTSLLLAELAKPLSNSDEEGYIYMFWLTDSNTTPPEAENVAQLLDTPRKGTPKEHRRRSSGVTVPTARDFASGARAQEQNSKILLKIGRTTNIQRRLSEWSKQCDHTLSLLRYYPYTSSSSPLPASPVRKVSHVSRVERLIHLELADLRVKKNCEVCGREHREWFGVEGWRGVRAVDEVVRRWVEWGTEG